MKPAQFVYHRPETLGAALELLARYGEGARLLAGGQSLVPLLNMRLARPAHVIDVNRVQGLDAIRLAAGGLVLGAMVRQQAALESALVVRHAPMLVEALAHVGHLATRTRGTVGGALAHADPAGELPACAVALDATLSLASPAGVREVRADGFFRGVFTTGLAPGEILTAVTVPLAGEGWRSGFAELARRHGDFALVGLAARVRLDAGGRVTDSRLVFCGVGTTPVRAVACEAALRGAGLAADAIDAAADAAAREIDPPGDVLASANVRRRLARVLVVRMLARLRERDSLRGRRADGLRGRRADGEAA